LYRCDDIAGDEVSGIRLLAAPRGVGLAEQAGGDVRGQRVDRRGDGADGLGLIGPTAGIDVGMIRGYVSEWASSQAPGSNMRRDSSGWRSTTCSIASKRSRSPSSLP
jgi:hypothetical protein